MKRLLLRRPTTRAARSLLSAVLILGSAPGCANAVIVPESTAPATLGYADVADMVVAAPVIADVTVTRVTEIEAARATGLAAGSARLYVEANVVALLRGTAAMPPAVRFLADLPRDGRGRAPKLKKQRFFLFASQPDPARPAELRLVSPDSLLIHGSENERIVRAITREAVNIDAPPPITGIASAFHVAGTVLGEGETQIFLRTRSDQPISISILTRPGQDRRWAVSLGEIVDEAAAVPTRESLLGYRLACGLPDTLDPALVESEDEGARAAAIADYAYVRQAVGRCVRTRTPPRGAS